MYGGVWGGGSERWVAVGTRSLYTETTEVDAVVFVKTTPNHSSAYTHHVRSV